MRQRLFFSTLAIGLAVWAALPVPAQNGTTGPIELTISPQGPAVEGQQILVNYSVRNTSGRTIKYVFQERDVYGKTLPYVAGLKVRIVDASSQVLTQNDYSRDEWWSAYYTWPQVMLARRQKLDRIDIDSGEQVDRVVDLTTMLAGLEGINGGLRAGVYSVRMSLPGGRSNDLQLEVLASTP